MSNHRISNPQRHDHTDGPAQDNQDDAQQNEVDQDRGIVVNASDMPEDISVAKKKARKKRKPASKRGLGKPTGFEEFHADAPLTPEQYAESQRAFDPELPFVDRVLRAIQRFERTRKLSPERRDIFYKYLAYGGVDIGPNMFVGAQDTENMDKDQIDTVMAQANISDEVKQTIIDPKKVEEDPSAKASTEGSKLRSPEHLAKYVVDFEATMRGFLSRHAPAIYAFDTIDNVKLVTTTLERFMDYLLQHDVCPEYKMEVLKTRNLCRTAETQLWHCAQAQRDLPGDFNIACSTLFGGSFGQNYDGETYWGPVEAEGDVFVGLKPEQATQIVGFAIAGAATEDVYIRYLDITTGESAGEGFEVVNTVQDHGFEITKIEKPTQECLDLYKENTSEFRPVRKVFAKFFRNPDALPEDLTSEERSALESHEYQDENQDRSDDLYSGDYIFFIEQDPFLSLLCPGMRIEATIHQLNCGVFFFDDVLRVLPSFDLWLENELMLDWKEPRPVAGAPVIPWNVGGTEEVETADKSVVEHIEAIEQEAVDANGAVKQDDGLLEDHAHEAAMTQQCDPTNFVSANGRATNDDEQPY